jgi:DNA-binding MarR family transcriptional regulator
VPARPSPPRTEPPKTAPPKAEAPNPTDLFIALGAVVKRLRHSPLPGAEQGHSAFGGGHPAPRHIAALLQIATDGPIGMSELADRLHVSLATMSQVVTDLADWGLIERNSDEADRRRTFVSVAAAHRPLTRAIIDQRLRPLQRTLRRLEPNEATALLRGLVVLAEELGFANEPGAATAAPAKEMSR